MIQLKIWWHIHVKRHTVENWSHPLAGHTFFCITCYKNGLTQEWFGGSY